MVTPELMARVRNELAQGMSRAAIEQNLRIAGFEDTDIANCFTLIQMNQVLSQAPAGAVAPAAASAPQAPPPTPAGPLAAPAVPPVMAMPTAAPPVPHVGTQAISPPLPKVLTAQQVPTAALGGSPTSRKPHRAGAVLGTLLILLILLVLGGAGAYAYMFKIGPFANPPYSEANLLSGILAASARVKSSSYRIEGSVVVVPRDADAAPFTVKVSNEEELMEKYGRDYQRARDLTSLLSSRYVFPNGGYPQTLKGLADALIKRNPSLKSSLHTTDPLTSQPYGYAAKDGGKSFDITATFETKEAIGMIRRYTSRTSASTTTKFNGQTVTVNSANPSYFYLSSEPPKPYLVALGEMMRFLSPEVSASLAAAASTDLRDDAAGWTFNVDATGNFGDLSYKVNADAMKAGDDYYFRINNLPALFGSLSAAKGQWIQISATTSTTTAQNYGGGNEYAYLARELPKAEVRYKEDREAFVAFVRKVAAIADEERLVTLKQPSAAESVNGRVLYRYDLDVQKDAILPFYRRMVTAASEDEKMQRYKIFLDEGTEEYLQSEEFDQVFEYLKKNVTVTLWADQEGYPAKIVYQMRVVPPDTATQLKDKQVMLKLETDLSDINEPVEITKPADAKPIEEFQADFQTNLDGARSKGRDARRVADIKQLQLALELYYDQKGAYPPDITAAHLVTPGYISLVPKDPSTQGPYLYAALGTGAKCSGYHLGATLEELNSALSTDNDAAPATTCSGSARKDFAGKAAACGGVAASSDRCFDVSP